MPGKTPWLLGASAAIAALAFALWPSAAKVPSESATLKPSVSAPSPTLELPAPGTPVQVHRQWSDSAERDAFFVADMQARFSPHIHIQHAQIRMIEQMISYLRSHYPDDWRERMETFLLTGFPDLAMALMDKFESLERYNEWLLADRKQLQTMTPEARRKVLWEKRYAAFGTDANEIWAAELRNIRLEETLEAIDQNAEATLNQKLESLLTVMAETHGDNAPSFIQKRQAELMNKFVTLPSVQNELGSMAPPVRRDKLRELRGKLGMAEDALDRWEALDKARDEAWNEGESYMAQREAIVSQYEGSEKNRELYALQEKVFGEDAEQIRREEASGFYRYDHQRQIGKE